MSHSLPLTPFGVHLMSAITANDALKAALGKIAATTAVRTNVGVEITPPESKITVPIDVGVPNAIKHLTEWEANQSKQVAISANFPGVDVFEGMVAFSEAMTAIYGFTSLRDTPGFFGDKPPTMVSVRTGPSSSDTIQVPWGRMSCPGFDKESFLQTAINVTDAGVFFSIGGQVQRRFETQVTALVTRINETLRTRSIYRSRALRVNFNYLWDDNVEFDLFNNAPVFMTPDGFSKADLIFADTVASEIDRSIFTLIEHTATCRAAGIPLKRGVLLAGGYGCGKTMTARVLSNLATQNGWTFLLCSDIRDLPYALKMASRYDPCVVFAEDIDSLIKGSNDSERTHAVNELLNTIDGMEIKGKSILTVLTSNDPKSIHPSFLRPGRVDSYIEVVPPDAPAALRLIRLFGGASLSPSDTFEPAARTLAGQIPATIREIVERSKLSAISRTSGSDPHAPITSVDIINAYNGMKPHISMFIQTNTPKLPERIQAAHILAAAISSPSTSPSPTNVRELVTSNESLD